jgi:hypothetical protein
MSELQIEMSNLKKLLEPPVGIKEEVKPMLSVMEQRKNFVNIKSPKKPHERYPGL